MHALSVSSQVPVHLFAFKAGNLARFPVDSRCIHHDQVSVAFKITGKGKAECPAIQQRHLIVIAERFLKMIDNMDTHPFISQQGIANAQYQRTL